MMHEEAGAPAPGDGLEGALRAAFAEVPESVLERLNLPPAGVPRVLLREMPEQGAPLIDPGTPEAGETGRYRVDGEIARGGVGVVLKGHDVDLGRDVALKVLREEYARTPEMLARFVEEAQIGGQLQHPGIVPVYELGLRADKRPFFTMKLVRGRTLAVLLSERQGAAEEPRRFLTIFEAVCQTLAYAHARGVVHRDLKPSNVMVGAFGEVQVLDWGLAKVLARGGAADDERSQRARPDPTLIATVRSGSSASASLAGSVMGTPAYMPPEQARGEIEHVDERSDVFALGAILCEILTGKPPYVGERMELLELAREARLDGARARLAACGAEAELVALAERCLRADQHERPRSAEVLAHEITAHLARADERARAAELAAAEARVAAVEERKARKLTLALAASVLLTVLVAGGGWAWVEQRRSGRAQATERVVSAAIEEASLCRGRSEWAGASTAAQRAVELARAGEADTSLLVRAEDLLAEVRREELVARAEAEQAERDRRMVERLESFRDRRMDAFDRERLSAWMDEAFREYGIDVTKDETAACAHQVLRSRISERLIRALFEWVRYGGSDEERVTAVFSACCAHRDSFWSGLAQADSLSACRELAESEALATLGPPAIEQLAVRMGQLGEWKDSLALIERWWPVYPGDCYINLRMAIALQRVGREDSGAAADTVPLAGSKRRSESAQRALPFALAATCLRPASALAWSKLGQILLSTGDVAGAIRANRESIRLQPEDWMTHYNLSSDLWCDGQLSEARGELEEAVRLAPEESMAHMQLGAVLMELGELPRARLELRAGLDARGRFGVDIKTVASWLYLAGDFERMVAVLRAGIGEHPGDARLHGMLGDGLWNMRKLREAIEEYRSAVRLAPADGLFHKCLMEALAADGDWDEALRELEAARACGAEFSTVSFEELSDFWRLAQRTEERLPEILRGEDPPLTPGERLALAFRCMQGKRHSLCATLCSRAFAEDPSLSSYPLVPDRHWIAACAAAQAGVGAGLDAPAEDDRAALRRRALDWLHEDLDDLGELAAGGGAAGERVIDVLRRWRMDPDLAGLRDEPHLAALPEEEQAACRALWSAVSALRARIH